MGTILSVSQVVGASDSIAQRIYMYKDVRWLQHCSTQVIQHLKTLVITVEKGLCALADSKRPHRNHLLYPINTAYVSSDTRSRSSNPNFLSLTSMDKTLAIVTDLIRSTKELGAVATPIFNGYISSPTTSNVGSLMKILCDRATIMDVRKTLESSQAFLLRSLQHMASPPLPHLAKDNGLQFSFPPPLTRGQPLMSARTQLM